QLITRFHYPGDFMYHCHVLEHEDNGMMGQFRVE
ncbi:MAG: multicopper oxidase domain-containing protein, partial [Proteobacteria bacterium]|nr:multicopper oxidase domain-containing protein [Pseudomonadota bacterium]